MRGVFQLWVKGCEINGTRIYPLEGSGENALYKCWKEFIVNHREYTENPVYIGWMNGKQVCAVQDYLTALRIWKDHRDKLENKEVKIA